MDDLLNRLRAPMWQVEPTDIQRVASDAAREIERLRKEVAEARSSALREAAEIARAESRRLSTERIGIPHDPIDEIALRDIASAILSRIAPEKEERHG